MTVPRTFVPPVPPYTTPSDVQQNLPEKDVMLHLLNLCKPFLDYWPIIDISPLQREVELFHNAEDQSDWPAAKLAVLYGLLAVGTLFDLEAQEDRERLERYVKFCVGRNIDF